MVKSWEPPTVTPAEGGFHVVVVECLGMRMKFWGGLVVFDTATSAVADVYPVAEAVNLTVFELPLKLTGRLYDPTGGLGPDDVVAETRLLHGFEPVVEQLTVAPPMPRPVTESFTTPLMVELPAARYGPTNGPPVPTGLAPFGSTKSVPVSREARARLSLPLPVWP